MSINFLKFKVNNIKVTNSSKRPFLSKVILSSDKRRLQTPVAPICLRKTNVDTFLSNII